MYFDFDLTQIPLFPWAAHQEEDLLVSGSMSSIPLTRDHGVSPDPVRTPRAFWYIDLLWLRSEITSEDVAMLLKITYYTKGVFFFFFFYVLLIHRVALNCYQQQLPPTHNLTIILGIWKIPGSIAGCKKFNLDNISEWISISGGYSVNPILWS